LVLLLVAWALLSYAPIGGWLFLGGVAIAVVTLVVALRNPIPSDAAKAAKALWILAIAVPALSLGGAAAGGFAGFIGSGTEELPSRITDPVAQFEEVYAFAQANLEFDDDEHSRDEQWLDIKDTVRVDTAFVRGDKEGRREYRFDTLPTPRVGIGLGPRGIIWPETSSHRNRRSDLGPGNGRVVAKMWIDPAYRSRSGAAGYPKPGFQLPPDTSYLYIDSLVVTGVTGTFRALVISPSGVFRVPTTEYYFEKRRWSNRSGARWMFDPNDICACESCASHGWCKTGCT
jgi:hypothetical protein